MYPTVTAAQMREVDRVMTDELGIALLQMMENAGRALAEQARRSLGGRLRDRRVTILAGGGGNGGGGLAAARRMAIWGAHVRIVLAADPVAAATAAQLRILERTGLVPSHDDRVVGDADLLVDALVGYSLRGAPRGRVADLIRAANAAHVPILALDVPSGLDPDVGEPRDPTIRARWTLTLALPKTGLVLPHAREWVGELFLADISVPALVYERLGLTVGPIFDEADIVPVG